MKKNNSELISDLFYTIITGIVLVVGMLVSYIVMVALLSFFFIKILEFIFN